MRETLDTNFYPLYAPALKKGVNQCLKCKRTDPAFPPPPIWVKGQVVKVHVFIDTVYWPCVLLNLELVKSDGTTYWHATVKKTPLIIFKFSFLKTRSA